MIEVALKFSVLVAVAWAFTRGVRPAGAATARAIWLGVLASPLLFPLLTPALFSSVVPGHVQVSSPLPVPPAWLPQAVAAVYLTVTIALLMKTAAGWLRASRIVRASRPLEAADAARLRALAGAPVLRLATADLDGPVTAGILRPLVLLPRDWSAQPEATLRAMLRHEAAHVRRRDPALALVGCLVHAALWFTPAAAVARREFLRCTEAAADAAAAAEIGASEYAEALLGLASARRMRGVPMLAAGGTESSIARRVRVLLDDLEFGPQSASRMRMAAVALAATLTLLAAVRVGDAASAPLADEPTVSAGDTLTPAHALRHAIRHAGH